MHVDVQQANQVQRTYFSVRSRTIALYCIAVENDKLPAEKRNKSKKNAQNNSQSVMH